MAFGGRKPSGGAGKGRGAGAGDKQGGQRRGLFRRRKVCKFCADRIDDINYKDVRTLTPFISEKGKILPRRITGVCAAHQRMLTEAVKQARNIALLPFAASA